MIHIAVLYQIAVLFAVAYSHSQYIRKKYERIGGNLWLFKKKHPLN